MCTLWILSRYEIWGFSSSVSFSGFSLGVGLFPVERGGGGGGGFFFLGSSKASSRADGTASSSSELRFISTVVRRSRFGRNICAPYI
jgi:hypothetical protein